MYVYVCVCVRMLACSDLNAPTTTLVELTLFLIMGNGVFLIWNDIVATFPYPAIILFLLGGGAYLFGITFFILGEHKPIYHTVWHLFVVIAAALHWFDVYFFIVRTDIGAAAVARIEEFQLHH